MTQIMRWIGVLALVWAAGCGKKETQVVKPRVTADTDVVVWVDQTGITSGQIKQEVARLYANAPKDLPPEQLQVVQARVLQQAIDNLVVRQLVKAEMERSGVVITPEEIEAGKQELEKGLGEGYSLAMLIAAANLPMDELEANLRLDLFKNKVLKDKIDAALATITDESVKAYYDGHPQEFTIPAGRQAAHILVRIPKDADEKAKADLRAKAEGIRKSLQEGADFAKLAGEVSDCPSRTRGGALGVIPKGREAPAFEAAVYGQAIDAIGEVVESPVGFHVIKVTGEQEEKVIPFDEVKERLTLVLRNQEQQKVTVAYIEELKAKATIKLDDALQAAVAESQQAAAPAPAAAAPAVTAPAEETPAATVTAPESAPASAPAP